MRDLTYPPIIVACKTAFKVLGLRFRISGCENIPRSGPAILAVNHISYMDFVLAGLAALPSKRLVRFMAKTELFRHPVSGPLMRSLHHIEVDREDGGVSYRTALQYLADGEVVGIFPEATISRAMELKAFKSGTVRMAAQAGAPVIPVVVWGGQRLITKGRPRDLSRGKAITLLVGEPLHIRSDDVAGETQRLHDTMAAMLDTAIKEYPQHEPGAWWVPARYGGSAPTLAEAGVIEAEERAARRARRAAERDNLT